MVERDLTFERHNELWKDQSKGLGRLALGTFLFAALVLLRVLEPYVADSGSLAAEQENLQQVRSELQKIEARRADVAPIVARLERIRERIERQPWMEHKDDLIETLRDLGDSFEAIVDKDPSMIPAAMSRDSVSATQQLPERPQVEPLKTLRIEEQQLSRFRAGDPSYRQFLTTRYRERVQEEADAAINRIVESVHTHVVRPLDELVSSAPERESAESVEAMVAELREDMERWAARYVGNRSWYRTIQDKDKSLAGLTSDLKRRQSEFIQPVRTELDRLGASLKEIGDEERMAQEREEGIGTTIHDLNDRLQELLPGWLRNLVHPSEMLQLYPLILLALAGLLGLRAWQVRSHYLVVRAAHDPPDLSHRDPAMSSVWTLVYRGRTGTIWTALVYIGGCVLLIVLFEQGGSLLASWLEDDPAAAWRPAEVTLSAFRWVGRLSFLAGVFVIGRTLWKDDRRRRSSGVTTAAERC